MQVVGFCPSERSERSEAVGRLTSVARPRLVPRGVPYGENEKPLEACGVETAGPHRGQTRVNRLLPGGGSLRGKTRPGYPFWNANVRSVPARSLGRHSHNVEPGQY